MYVSISPPLSLSLSLPYPVARSDFPRLNSFILLLRPDSSTQSIAITTKSTTCTCTNLFSVPCLGSSACFQQKPCTSVLMLHTDTHSLSFGPCFVCHLARCSERDYDPQKFYGRGGCETNERKQRAVFPHAHAHAHAHPPPSCLLSSLYPCVWLCAAVRVCVRT